MRETHAFPMFKLADAEGDGLNPTLSQAGVFLGDGSPMVKLNRLGHFEVRPYHDLAPLWRRLYGPEFDGQRRMQGLALVARCLNSGEIGKAQIALLHCEFPPLEDLASWEKYSPSEPRDARGRWTTGGATSASAAPRLKQPKKTPAVARIGNASSGAVNLVSHSPSALQAGASGPHITAAQLHQIFPHAGNRAEIYAGPLSHAMAKYGINTPYRQAAFLAQVGVESNQLRNTSEDLNYSARRLTQIWRKRFPTLASAAPYANNPQALANLVYANKNGNGDEASGDGYAYRGGGLLQLTFRGNYRAAGYENNPDEVRKSPIPAANTAAFYWRSRGLNVMSDAPLTRAQFDQITRKINGPRMLEAEARWELYQHALSTLEN